MTAQPAADVVIDERGHACPLPVIALMKATTASRNRVIAVLADDPAAEFDIPAWCRMKGAEFLGVDDPPDGGSGRAYFVVLRD